MNYLIAPINQRLSTMMPWWLPLTIWGLMAGSLSVLIYWLTAPEKRLEEVRKEAAAARALLNRCIDREAEFGRTMKQAWESIRLSLKELGLVAGPTLFACAPGLIFAGALGHEASTSGAGTQLWWRSDDIVFFASALLSALTLRRILTR